MSRVDALRAELERRPVLFDGATGSYAAALFGELDAYERDRLALLDPGKVLRVHRDYLAAGARALKTATFNANAIALAAGRGAAPVPVDEAYELNAAAAALARAAAAEAESRDGLVRWVAGSIGPGSAAPSLGGPGYRELVASYLPQARGLVAGGADLALIETVQDPVQAKAAIEAWKLACDGAGRALPFVVSATVDAAGRLLSGASPAAFAAAVEPFGPLAVGLNCSGGPQELMRAYAALAAFASTRLSFIPNAGLPRRGLDGELYWPLAPEAYASAMAAAWGDATPSLVGGCCGTDPGHIEALARQLADGEVGRGPRRRSFALASAFEAKPLRPGRRFLIDERSNAQGSAAFKRLVADGDQAAALRFVLERASSGADGADLNVAGPRERVWLPAIAAAAAPLASAALSLDSVDPEALTAALPGLAGRPLVNSVNLEDEPRAERLLRLAARHGAAVVCLALDADGPARDAKAKLEVARRLYELSLKAGLEPADLLFDLCTFPAAAGGAASAGSAYETFAALAALGEACPGAGSVLGVGNSSFGLPKAMRPRFTAAFLERALEAGLSAAIVDPAAAGLLGPDGRAADEEQRRFARLAQPFFGPGEPSAQELDALLTWAESAPAAGCGAADAAADAEGRGEGASSFASGPASPAEALGDAIAERNAPAALMAIQAALGDGIEPSELARRIAEAMAALGKRYDAGNLPLPLVLCSADVARAGFDALKSAAALETAATGPVGQARRLVLLSTVKGDLHDIGKNLVAMVLEAGGYEVADLGIDRGADEIAEAAVERGAFAVGVSGLLTRSLVEMEAVAEALARRGSKAPLLCGGAAVDRAFVSERLEPLRPGLVRYGKDPFEALRILGSLAAPDRADPPRRPAGSESPAVAGSECSAEGVARPAGAAAPPVGDSPAVYLRFTLGELVPLLDRPTIIEARLRFGRADRARGERLLDEALSLATASAAAEGYEPGAEASYSWFAVRAAPGDAIEFYPAGAADPGARSAGSGAGAPDFSAGIADTGAGGRGPIVSFAFPREPDGKRRSLYDYYSTLSEAPAFCVTLGAWAEAALRRAKEAGDGGLYLATHAVLAGLSEAAAEFMHRRLADEARALGMDAPGKRYSFGYPACPGVERNAELLAALGAGGVGLKATQSGQLVPEFSVSALVIPLNAAEYFNPRPKKGNAEAPGREGVCDA